MMRKLLDEIRSYVGFTELDAGNIKSLAVYVRPKIPLIVERFYEVLLSHPSASQVFIEGETQIARQKVLLSKWLYEVFEGICDDSYFDARFRIGTTHVRVGLPQRYMFLGMEIIWQEVCRVVQESFVGSDLNSRLGSLRKLLTMDLTVMLESYQESYSEAIRRTERNLLEDKLIRAEHLAEIGQLAASLAHEIKNPLAGISAAIQIISESLENHEHREIATVLLQQVDRLNATMNDLLAYARPSPPSFQSFIADDLVQRVVTLLREEPALQKVRVERRASETRTELFADEGQIEQVLINLILNAAQASVEGGVISLEIQSIGDSTRISIQDRGQGMAPDVLKRALKPFFTTKAKGTGLGLAICRRIVESHGGSLYLESSVGSGTTVHVQLPQNRVTKGGHSS